MTRTNASTPPFQSARRLVAVAFAGVAVAVAAVPAAAQDDDSQLEVIPLKWADAMKVTGILQTTVSRNQAHRFTADPRSNSIIVSAPDVVIARARALLAELDVELSEAGPDDEDGVRVFELTHATASPHLADMLGSLFGSQTRGGPRVPVAWDQSTNQLIARGASSDLDRLGSLIEAIDRPGTETGGAAEMQVRLVWLVRGEAVPDRGPVPGDLDPALQELRRIGVTDLKLAFQTLVRVSVDRRFTTRFATRLDKPWTMSFNGTVSAGAGGTRQLDLRLDGVSGSGTDHTQIETTITARPGHLVVLGVNPIQDMDSVFVVQVRDLEQE